MLCLVKYYSKKLFIVELVRGIPSFCRSVPSFDLPSDHDVYVPYRVKVLVENTRSIILTTLLTLEAAW
jgi:hypothetical protein